VVYKKYFSIALFAFFCFSSQLLSAHAGKHYQKGDILNSWGLANGKTIRGNFARNNGDQIVLEQLGGKFISIPLSSLTEQDQKLAIFKINKYTEVNQEPVVFDSSSRIATQIFSKGIPFLFYLLKSFLLFLILRNYFIIRKKNTHKKPYFGILCALCLIEFTGFIACKKSNDTTITPIETIAKTSTSFIDAAFNPYKSNVTTSWDDTYFYAASNGLPTHNMMVGITNWQQQVPISQPYIGTNKWSIPLQPVYATTPLSTKTNFMKGAVALAVNGIPIFNALNNRGEDSYLIGELDQWGGHCGKGDDYHYHAAPLHLSATSGLNPIAFALDGFAVYGTKEPDGAAMATLDDSHGHIYNGGVYHYHGTTTYPYVIGAMKGKVVTDSSTPAPENQILPQAFSSPLRPATSPLSGASITAFTANGTNAYLLTYKIGTKNGYIDYSWDATNKYIFTFTTPDGAVTTSTYQRK
jgi:hypothetical protein